MEQNRINSLFLFFLLIRRESLELLLLFLLDILFPLTRRHSDRFSSNKEKN